MFGIWLSKELPLCSRTGKVFSKNITFLALTRSKKHGEQTNKTKQTNTPVGISLESYDREFSEAGHSST